MDMGIQFYNLYRQPFEVVDDNGKNVESSSAYKDIPTEMPGVSLLIHDELDLLDYFSKATIATEDNAC